jgi:hypothetical protein
LIVSIRYAVELRRQENEAAKGLALINDHEFRGVAHD